MELGEAQAIGSSLVQRMEEMHPTLVSFVDREALRQLIECAGDYQAFVTSQQHLMAKMTSQNQLMDEMTAALERAEARVYELEVRLSPGPVDENHPLAQRTYGAPDLSSDAATASLGDIRSSAADSGPIGVTCQHCGAVEHLVCEEGLRVLSSCEAHVRYNVRCAKCMTANFDRSPHPLEEE